MKPDSMLVEPEHIIRARREVSAKGSYAYLNEFAEMEPALASFVSESLTSAAGRLSISGAPTELVRGSHEEVLRVVLASVQAMRRGHYALWKGTVVGTRLAELDPSLESKTRRRRKTSELNSAPQEEEASATGPSDHRPIRVGFPRRPNRCRRSG
jgi:hypothetical protein